MELPEQNCEFDVMAEPIERMVPILSHRVHLVPQVLVGGDGGTALLQDVQNVGLAEERHNLVVVCGRRCAAEDCNASV